jgi:uncharacterized protein
MRLSMTHIISLNTPQKKGIITGYASFFDLIDHQNDRIVKGAFAKTLKAWRLLGKMPKMLWQHDPKSPIGIWTRLYEDEKGLYAEGKLALGIQKADEAYLLLKEGIMDGLSIGFRPITALKDKTSKTRILLDIDLIEISLVTFGANTRAVVTQVKAGH